MYYISVRITNRSFGNRTDIERAGDIECRLTQLSKYLETVHHLLDDIICHLNSITEKTEDAETDWNDDLRLADLVSLTEKCAHMMRISLEKQKMLMQEIDLLSDSLVKKNKFIKLRRFLKKYISV